MYLDRDDARYLSSLVRMDLRKQERSIPKLMAKFGEAADLSGPEDKINFGIKLLAKLDVIEHQEKGQ